MFAVLTAALGLLVSGASASIPDTPNGALASPRNPAGAGVGGAVADVSVSGGGRYVVFDSSATNLYSGQSTDDKNGTCDVFRRDLYTGTTILVSRVSATGAVGNGCSSHPAIDYDGNEIAFLTTATNLGATSTTKAAAVVRNISSDTLTTASVSNGSSGTAASDSVGAVAISGDGTTVTFTSASNLASGVTTNGVIQVWARNLSAGTTTLVSSTTGSSTAPASSAAGASSVDEYGADVAFTSAAALTGTATGGVGQVYVRNLSGSTTTLASRAAGASGAVANKPATAPSLSALGNAVGFLSSATNLGDSTGQADDYVRSLTGATTKLADTAANGTTLANKPAGAPSLSAYGNIVAFASAATNLGASPDAGGHQQVWVHDLTRGTVTLASPATGSTSGANGASTGPSLAQGGIDLAYGSAASNLDPGDVDTTVDAYVHRVRVAIAPALNTTSLVTRDGLDGRSSTNQPSGDAGQPTQFAVSGNDLYVAFELPRTPLTGEFTPGVDSGVYVRNLQTGEVELVSRASDAGGDLGPPLGDCGSGEDSYVGISGDGRYVAFAANAEDGDGCQIWLRDRQNGTTTRESVATGGAVANADSFYPALASNGQYLLFASRASNLAPHHPAVGATPGPLIDLYERDLQTGTTTIVSLPDGAAPGGTTFAKEASGFDDQSSVSNDGRFVAFESRDAQLQAGSPYPAGEEAMTYLRDLQTNRTYALQHEPGSGGGTWGDSSSFSRSAKVSTDGSTVTFDSNSANLVPGHASTQQDVYYRAVQFDSSGNLNSPIHIASVPNGAEPGSGGTFGNAGGAFPAISSDGRLIAFVSSATNDGTTVAAPEVWVRDTQAATTALVSRLSGASGLPANGGGTSFAPGMSADGTVVAFESSAPNLNPDGAEQELGYVRFVPAPPSAPIAGTPSVSGDLHDGSTVTCDPGSWTGNPTFSYKWLRGAAQTPIPGATSNTYELVDADVDGQLACQVIGTVTGAPSAMATSAAVTPLPDPPVNLTAPEVENAGASGDTASCDPGTWTATPSRDAPTNSDFTFQWFVGGSPVSGATGQTFLVTPGDGGQSLGCEVFATNAGGVTTATSPGVTPIPPAPVNLVQPSLSYASPVTNGTLVTCNPGQWQYNPTVTVTWSRNGVSIPGATSRTYLLGAADIHATVNCSEFATNAAGLTAVDSSNTTGIVLQAAAVPLVAPEPVEPALGQRGCQAGKFSYPTPVSFSWFRNGMPIGAGDQAGTAGPGQILTLTDADLGASLSCAETSTNADGFSSSAGSGSIQIPTSKCTIASYFFSQQGPPASDDLVYNSPYSHDGTPVLGSYSPGETACLGYQDPDAPASAAPPLPKPVPVLVSGGIVALKIKCLGKNGYCESKLTLTTTQLVLHALVVGAGAKAKPRPVKPIVIATTHYKIKTGKKLTAYLHLSHTGLKLLAREHKLTCTLIIRPRDGKPRVFEYMSLRARKGAHPK